MSMLLRSAPLRAARVARQPLQARMVHIENVIDHTIPVNVRNRFSFGAKFAVFITCGFGLPFFASWYQIKKAAGN